jgi:hypothetical protein
MHRADEFPGFVRGQVVPCRQYVLLVLRAIYWDVLLRVRAGVSRLYWGQAHSGYGVKYCTGSKACVPDHASSSGSNETSCFQASGAGGMLGSNAA